METKKYHFNRKSIFVNILMAFTFIILGLVLYILDGNLFFIINFGFIGLVIGVGFVLYSVLPKEKKHIGKRLSQLLIGLYLFIVIGILMKLNIQFEGVWFELLYGVMTAPLIHYLVAKIFGTVIIGRIYCGWACWTGMVLDLLPFNKNKGRIKRLGIIRYLHFFISIAIVLIAWFALGYSDFTYFAKVDNISQTAFVSNNYSLLWFFIGNIIYYILGIALAIILKDNRAFCKYICPITVFMKLGTRFSLIKIKGKKDECISCGLCVKSCPMDIDIIKYIKERKRVLSSECILCQTCKDNCPYDILSLSTGLDAGIKEYLVYKKQKID